MTQPDDQLGDSTRLVAGKGFENIEGWPALIGHDDNPRLFAELTAEPDLPQVRPGDAYRALLASLDPGWGLRFLQIIWPDPAPRLAYLRRVHSWKSPDEARRLLRDGLADLLETAPPADEASTILELSFPRLARTLAMAWWESLPGLLGTYGIDCRPLEADEVQELSYRLLNPRFPDPPAVHFGEEGSA